MQAIKGYLIEWVKCFIRPEDEWYADVVYTPSEGCRLFDNEEQARRAGYIHISETKEDV